MFSFWIWNRLLLKILRRKNYNHCCLFYLCPMDMIAMVFVVDIMIAFDMIPIYGKVKKKEQQQIIIVLPLNTCTEYDSMWYGPYYFFTHSIGKLFLEKYGNRLQNSSTFISKSKRKKLYTAIQFEHERNGLHSILNVLKSSNIKMKFKWNVF